VNFNFKGEFAMTRKLLLLAAMFAFCLAFVLFAACSSDSDSPSSSGTNNPPTGSTVNISGSAFSPTNLTITVGTKVTWTNNDGVAHTVTSTDDRFSSSGNLGNGATYEFTFNEVGSFPYHCTIHPSMTGTITVTN
jgi:plastocyanin